MFYFFYKSSNIYIFLAVLLRGLDALSSEDAVLNCLMRSQNLPIKSIRIGKDALTNTSRGVCYVEMNSVVDAMFLHNQLLGEPPTIDDKLVSVSYYRPPLTSHHSQYHSGSASGSTGGGGGGSDRGGKDNVPTKAANAALEAAQWSHQSRQGIANQYSHDDIERMAEYSASMYAKNASDKAHYLEYYRNYYRNGGDPNAGAQASATAQKNSSPTPSDTVSKGEIKEKITVNGVDYPRFPTPDVSTYSYDEATGYYYDASTQLYYDSNSQYYLNAKTNKYVYWSPDHHTYLPAPETTTETNAEDKESGANANGNDKKKDASDKKDKVKTAKRIAKDMEKWAKTLNQKAAKAQQQQQPQQQQQQQQQQAEQQYQAINIGMSASAAPATVPSSISMSTQGGFPGKSSEDVAFSMLQNKNENEVASSGGSGLAKLTGYGSDSADEDTVVSNHSSGMDEQQFTDWPKLACLLCKRQFPSREKLTK